MTDDSDDEARALFRGAVGPVRRLKDDRITPSRPPKQRYRPPPSATAIDNDNLPLGHGTLTAADTLFHARPGVQNKLLRKLRRGQLPVSAELDLHGQTRAQALASLEQFLAQCRARRYRCVRIIHGKGYSSTSSHPVLKNTLNAWLQHEHGILAFCSAPPAQGGTGAVNVLLRMPRDIAQDELSD